MRSPLPGMNPYLEQPMFWSAFHSRLIVAIADAIAPQIRPQYYVEIELKGNNARSETLRDRAPIVEMQSIFEGIYERAGYDLRIDYTQLPPPPVLSESDRLWLQNSLQSN